jgi:hypothetical protein
MTDFDLAETAFLERTVKEIKKKIVWLMTADESRGGKQSPYKLPFKVPLNEVLTLKNKDIPLFVTYRHDTLQTVGSANQHKVLFSILAKFGLWHNGRETLAEHAAKVKKKEDSIRLRKQHALEHQLEREQRRLDAQAKRVGDLRKQVEDLTVKDTIDQQVLEARKRLEADAAEARSKKEAKIQAKLAKLKATEQALLDEIDREAKKIADQIAPEKDYSDDSRVKTLNRLTVEKLTVLAESIGLFFPDKLLKSKMIEKILEKQDAA